MKVQNVMVREVISIRPDISARQALELLFKNQISGLPVIDETGKLVGMFTEKDVLSFVLPSYIEKVGRFIYQDDPKSTKKKFFELDTVKVQQMMRKDVVTTTEETSLCEVARIMLTQKARRLPVLNKDGKVIGIIARCDVVKALAAIPEASA
jgi:CBS domain-containing protein